MPARCLRPVRPETDSQPRVPSHVRHPQAPRPALPPRRQPADARGPARPRLRRKHVQGGPDGLQDGCRRHRGLRHRPGRPHHRQRAGGRRLRGVRLPDGRLGAPHGPRRRRHGRHGLGPRQRRHRGGAAAQHLRDRHQDHQFRHRRAHGAGARHRHPGGDHPAAHRHGRPGADHAPPTSAASSIRRAP